MVNGINIPGGINFSALQNANKNPEIKKEKEAASAPAEILETQGASAIEQAVTAREYGFKYELSVKNWCRRSVGTYPKWFANLLKPVLRFAVKRILRKRIEFVMRGRGPRVAAAKKYGFKLNCDRDLPIRYAKKVAVYVSIFRRKTGV